MSDQLFDIKTFRVFGEVINWEDDDDIGFDERVRARSETEAKDIINELIDRRLGGVDWDFNTVALYEIPQHQLLREGPQMLMELPE